MNVIHFWLNENKPEIYYTIYRCNMYSPTFWVRKLSWKQNHDTWTQSVLSWFLCRTLQLVISLCLNLPWSQGGKTGEKNSKMPPRREETFFAIVTKPHWNKREVKSLFEAFKYFYWWSYFHLSFVCIHCVYSTLLIEKSLSASLFLKNHFFFFSSLEESQPWKSSKSFRKSLWTFI